ncbi:LLM class flavin-dependent oxidoreductase [Oceanobacillus saliphilus]|uniref:LLM class flavin-dependent oxidoreductase n=1 Tax=Oceanobacillus saliphilus TaxID=2925834 RepID=UPI00201DBA3F|nr:LLM class flavin-dependent oxidoreductase [Oceanobacillus saliphilus]
MSKTLSLTAFVMNTASHIVHGTWRDPRGGQRDFNDLSLWTSLAKELEDGGFDTIFLADVVGLYGDYEGGWESHIRNGLQVPSNDPFTLASAIAATTERLGIAVTAGVYQQPPYNFARQMSTLDHLSRGRVAWNIVTGYLENGFRNYGYDGMLPHDERYDTADEYLDVVYKLWEGSWDDEALKKDRETGIYADPAHVHKIHHESKHYKVEGPHLVSPSPQRTPLLFQAGASTRGKAFAAQHAEAVFINTPNPEAARSLVAEVREKAVQNGRRGEDVQFFQGQWFVIGETEEEAQKKAEELDEIIDYKMMIAHFGGGMGIDFGKWDLDTPIEDIETDGVRGIFNWIKQSVEGRKPTLHDVAAHHGRTTRCVGTPEQIADRLEEWLEAGVSGINVMNAFIPSSYTEFIEKVVPILAERGLLKEREAVPETLRGRLFGQDRLSERHPAARYRRSFGGVRS